MFALNKQDNRCARPQHTGQKRLKLSRVQQRQTSQCCLNQYQRGPFLAPVLLMGAEVSCPQILWSCWLDCISSLINPMIPAEKHHLRAQRGPLWPFSHDGERDPKDDLPLSRPELLLLLRRGGKGARSPLSEVHSSLWANLLRLLSRWQVPAASPSPKALRQCLKCMLQKAYFSFSTCVCATNKILERICNLSSIPADITWHTKLYKPGSRLWFHFYHS